jgi:hypothetical protein
MGAILLGGAVETQVKVCKVFFFTLNKLKQTIRVSELWVTFKVLNKYVVTVISKWYA